MKSKKLRDSARGQECTFQIPGVCNYDTSTVVLCHLPSKHNTGMGMKCPDYIAAFGCSSCHDHIDQNRLTELEKCQISRKAMESTWKVWVEMGLLSFPETYKKQKVVNKIVDKKPMYNDWMTDD